MRPRKCYGPDAARAIHAPGCRPSRPLCRFRRLAYVCGCDAYHFPHRRGGGLCGLVAAQWSALEARAAGVA